MMQERVTPAWRWSLRAAAALLLLGLALAHGASERGRGFSEGLKHERAARAVHDREMRGMGVCRWAEKIAELVECRKEDRP